jgi:hypothetical protein
MERQDQMKDWKYILYLGVIFAIYLAVQLTSTKVFDWNVTYGHDDKNPYGTYAMNRLMPSVLGDVRVSHSYKTLYELKDSLKADDNVFVVTNRFWAGDEDVKILLDHVYKGGTAFIAAQSFGDELEDSLKFSTKDYLFNNTTLGSRDDTTQLRFVNASLDTTRAFFYKADDVHQYFNDFDRKNTTVIARNSNKQPVTLRMKFGQGNLYLNSTPMIFTNIYVLEHHNHEQLAGNLSLLAPATLHWTEYYHLGRMESQTPLRFILSDKSLRWAYLLALTGVGLFMIFDSKRKQRIIPVIPPLENTTLQFVSTIGNLYYEHGDHKNIADKKITFLLEQIRSKYYLPTNRLDETFVRALAQKAGKPESQIIELFNTVNYINTASAIPVDMLIDLNEKIEKFNT